MKTINIGISGSQMFCDFEGFHKDECQQEEEKLRLLMGGIGVLSDEEEKQKKRAEAEPEADPQGVRA